MKPQKLQQIKDIINKNEKIYPAADQLAIAKSMIKLFEWKDLHSIGICTDVRNLANRYRTYKDTYDFVNDVIDGVASNRKEATSYKAVLESGHFLTDDELIESFRIFQDNHKLKKR